jgi:hypothetical protein
MKKLFLNPYVIGIGIMAIVFIAVYCTSIDCLNYTK